MYFTEYIRPRFFINKLTRAWSLSIPSMLSLFGAFTVLVVFDFYLVFESFEWINCNWRSSKLHALNPTLSNNEQRFFSLPGISLA